MILVKIIPYTGQSSEKPVELEFPILGSCSKSLIYKRPSLRRVNVFTSKFIKSLFYLQAKLKENHKFSFHSLAVSKNNILTIYLLDQPTTPRIYFKLRHNWN